MLYNEFKGTDTQPIDVPGYGFWRTRVSNGYSAAYEIEQMEDKETPGAHSQRQPGVDVSPNYPLTALEARP